METNSSCDCAIEISQQFARWQARQGGGEVYQSSLMSALLAGVYEGETTMADLLRHGDFGLGTFNRLDGELIAFERQIHQLKADGSARPARAEQKTPFAVMTHFRPCLQRRFDHPLSREEIHQWVDRLVGTDNVFVAFRLDGLFEQAQAFGSLARVEFGREPSFDEVELVGRGLGERAREHAACQGQAAAHLQDAFAFLGRGRAPASGLRDHRIGSDAHRSSPPSSVPVMNRS